MTFHTETLQLHMAVCKNCHTKAEDTDADRLAEWMLEHQAVCG